MRSTRKTKRLPRALIAAPAMCIAAMLTACTDGTPPPVNVSSACRVVGRDLIGAQGKTWADQAKIDATLERLISAGCIKRTDLPRAKEAIRRAPVERAKTWLGL